MHETNVCIHFESCAVLDDGRDYLAACKRGHRAFQDYQVSLFQVCSDGLRGVDDGAQVCNLSPLLKWCRNRNHVDIAIFNGLGGQEVLANSRFLEDVLDVPFPDW